MPFSHIDYPVSWEEYLRQVGDLLEDQKTVVILDTNILSYLFKLLAAARTEFFLWTDRLIKEERLKIPAWVLTEYLSKLTSGKIDDYTARSKEPEEIRKKLDNLRSIASLFVDDNLLVRIEFSGTRTQFLEKFEDATKNLSELTKVFSHQFNAATIHKEIADKLGTAVLVSNISELTIRACTEGEMRANQRLPPGFKDIGKSDNKYGDLIIWFEILNFAKSNRDKFDKVVFLSNDEKPDWVYSPKNRTENIQGTHKVIANSKPTIRLADPRLVAEFHAVVGHRDFHIVSFPVFIEGLSKVRPGGLGNLASAIQVEVEKTVSERDVEHSERPNSSRTLGDDGDSLEQQIELERDADDLVIPKPLPTEVPLVTDTKASTSIDSNLVLDPVEISDEDQSALTYPLDALRDSTYEVDEASDLDVVIRELGSHNWYRQNPAVTQLRILRDGMFSKKAWFVLGRNIYQAACGNAQKALEFVRDIDIQLGRFPNDVANHILSGALFEVYFDSQGKFRENPKSSQIDPLFKVASNEQYKLATEFIGKMLEPFESRLIVIPGNTEEIKLNIQLVQTKVPSGSELGMTFESVNFAGYELLKPLPDKDDEDYLLQAVLHEDRLTVKSITSGLSENWVVPSWQIHTIVEPEFSVHTLIFVPDGKILHFK